MTTLSELEAEFIRYVERDGVASIHHVETLADAQGVMFLCPACFKANGGPVGTHAVICWSRSRGAPDHASPGPGRWKLEGTGLADLTLQADPPSTARSVQLTSGCGWHGFVTGGQAE